MSARGQSTSSRYTGCMSKMSICGQLSRRTDNNGGGDYSGSMMPRLPLTIICVDWWEIRRSNGCNTSKSLVSWEVKVMAQVCLIYASSWIITSEALRYGTCSQGISVSPAHSHVHPQSEWAMPAFAFPTIAGTHLPNPKGWKAELAWVAGYVARQFTCLKAVTHPTTNQVQCRATALIETNVWYGILGFNVPLDTVQVISETGGGSEQWCTSPIQ